MLVSCVTLVLVLTLGGWTEAKLNKYCAICKDHTMCTFQGIGEACEAVGEGGVSREDRSLILDLHNWYRRFVATGSEGRGKGGPQPKATNMRMMMWDNDLAAVAQRWADQCTFQHDTCRHDPRFKVGQNIYWNWRFPIIDAVNWTAAVSDWYSEVDKFDPKIVSSYQFDAATGHYTQMMWHDTYLVGCGRRNYGPNKIYVCNYGPTGNWLTQPMYSEGETCSQCPSNTVCIDGLCALKEPKPADTNAITPTGDFKSASPTHEPERTVFDLLTVTPKPADNKTEPSGPFKLSPTITLRAQEQIPQVPAAPIVTVVPEVTKNQAEPEFLDFLTPPRPDAESVYEKIPLGAASIAGETQTTVLEPETQTEVHLEEDIGYNIIEDLENTDDEEIRKEIEDLKLRIKNLVNKILAKRMVKKEQ